MLWTNVERQSSEKWLKMEIGRRRALSLILLSSWDEEKVRSVTRRASRRFADKYLPCAAAKTGCLPAVRHTDLCTNTHTHTHTHMQAVIHTHTHTKLLVIPRKLLWCVCVCVCLLCCSMKGLLIITQFIFRLEQGPQAGTWTHTHTHKLWHQFLNTQEMISKSFPPIILMIQRLVGCSPDLWLCYALITLYLTQGWTHSLSLLSVRLKKPLHFHNPNWANTDLGVGLAGHSFQKNHPDTGLKSNVI